MNRASSEIGLDRSGAGRAIPLADVSSLGRRAWGVRIGRGLLVLVPLVNILWMPLVTGNIGRRVNVVPMDVLLGLAWLVALSNVAFRHSRMSNAEKLAWQVVILANVPLLLSPSASLFVSDGANLLPGVLSHLKRIGLAAILVPLAVRCRLSEAVWPLLLPLLVSVGLLHFGPPGWLNLPAFSLLGRYSSHERQLGLFFNPNVLAYAASIHILLLLMYTQLRGNSLVKAAALLGITVSFLTFGSGASRSATIALVPAFSYWTWKRRSPAVFLALWALTLGALWFVTSDTFTDSVLATRWIRFLAHGIQEPNFAARLALQLYALRRSVQVPFGTGIGTAYTDSLYVDYLATMGFVGLASILLMLLKCWQGQESGRVEATTARSVLICAIVFSTASLGIASNFVAPLFFLTVGLGLSTLRTPAGSEIGSAELNAAAPPGG